MVTLVVACVDPTGMSTVTWPPLSVHVLPTSTWPTMVIDRSDPMSW